MLRFFDIVRDRKKNRRLDGWIRTKRKHLSKRKFTNNSRWTTEIDRFFSFQSAWHGRDVALYPIVSRNRNETTEVATARRGVNDTLWEARTHSRVFTLSSALFTLSRGSRNATHGKVVRTKRDIERDRESRISIRRIREFDRNERARILENKQNIGEWPTMIIDRTLLFFSLSHFHLIHRNVYRRNGQKIVSRDFWKIENLGSFFYIIFDKYHRNICLDFPQGRCLVFLSPTNDPSLIELHGYEP